MASVRRAYAFFCIDEMLTLDPTAAIKPTLIYLEEVWYLLKNKKLRERFDNWLRTLAKKNAIVGMTTQSLAEIADSDIFTTIIDNIQNRIFLPNPSVMAHLDLYRDKFQLNDEQIERIRTAKRKVQYYFVNPEGMSRMVNVKFPPEMLACLRSDQLARMKYEESLVAIQHTDGTLVDGFLEDRFDVRNRLSLQELNNSREKAVLRSDPLLLEPVRHELLGPRSVRRFKSHLLSEAATAHSCLVDVINKVGRCDENNVGGLPGSTVHRSEYLVRQRRHIRKLPIPQNVIRFIEEHNDRPNILGLPNKLVPRTRVGH